ncbi:WbuC family cupin fold metalloprotein [Pseudoalteromonas umbrosa]|uniref:WbuC family cupin fold metalloprotein n=1 Tax=Pseudoalteromonas umbrosa TaxID=3048489 RepID=UPI0024C3A97F|nr:WbuC family cupin fold metalloprotein [Pseudoalteromonas sp. B95]MDK1285613.1 WbuC family cupin fold metalloprotein [Pseudoalteromonas sp. B95]
MAVAYFNNLDVVSVDNKSINHIEQHAIESEQGHYRFCLHHDNSAPIQEMVIALTKHAIFPPHKHPLGKSESIHIISGELATFIFDNTGKVTQVIRQSCSGNQAKLQRIEGNTWHLPICISETVVYHETLVGPYDKASDVITPEWAPSLEDKEGLVTFYEQLKLLL